MFVGSNFWRSSVLGSATTDDASSFEKENRSQTERSAADEREIIWEDTVDDQEKLQNYINGHIDTEILIISVPSLRALDLSKLHKLRLFDCRGCEDLNIHPILHSLLQVGQAPNEDRSSPNQQCEKFILVNNFHRPTTFIVLSAEEVRRFNLDTTQKTGAIERRDQLLCIRTLTAKRMCQLGRCISSLPQRLTFADFFAFVGHIARLNAPGLISVLLQALESSTFNTIAEQERLGTRAQYEGDTSILTTGAASWWPQKDDEPKESLTKVRAFTERPGEGLHRQLSEYKTEKFLLKPKPLNPWTSHILPEKHDDESAEWLQVSAPLSSKVVELRGVIKELAKYYPGSVTLDLSGYPIDQLSSLLELLESFPLEAFGSLSLRNCPNFSQSENAAKKLINFLPKFPNLWKVDLSHCRLVDETDSSKNVRWLEELLKTLGNSHSMRILDLSYIWGSRLTPEVNDKIIESLTSMLQKLPNLVCLNLEGNHLGSLSQIPQRLRNFYYAVGDLNKLEKLNINYTNICDAETKSQDSFLGWNLGGALSQCSKLRTLHMVNHWSGRNLLDCLQQLYSLEHLSSLKAKPQIA